MKYSISQIRQSRNSMDGRVNAIEHFGNGVHARQVSPLYDWTQYSDEGALFILTAGY